MVMDALRNQLKLRLKNLRGGPQILESELELVAHRIHRHYAVAVRVLRVPCSSYEIDHNRALDELDVLAVREVRRTPKEVFSELILSMITIA